MGVCCKSAVLLAFRLCYRTFLIVLIVCVVFPFCVWDRMCNSIVSVPDHAFHHTFYDVKLLEKLHCGLEKTFLEQLYHLVLLSVM